MRKPCMSGHARSFVLKSSRHNDGSRPTPDRECDEASGRPPPDATHERRSLAPVPTRCPTGKVG